MQVPKTRIFHFFCRKIDTNVEKTSTRDAFSFTMYDLRCTIYVRLGYYRLVLLPLRVEVPPVVVEVADELEEPEERVELLDCVDVRAG